MNAWPFPAAVAVELRKTVGSRVIHATTILLVAGIGLLAGSLTAAVEGGNEEIIASLGAQADERGWELLTGITGQITAAGGMLGFGVALSWMIGREFTDATIGGLFARPVHRSRIVHAKILVFMLWTAVVAVMLVALVGLIGLGLGLGPVTATAVAALGRLLALAAMSALLALPAAWAATLGRGLLPGIATAVGLVVIAQVMVVAGTGAWFPLAAPALWVVEHAAVSPLQLGLVGVIPLVFGTVTVHAWARLQLDR